MHNRPQRDRSGDAWQGKRVRLRAFEPSHGDAYLPWGDDSEQARNLDALPFPASREATRRWAEQEASRALSAI